jgi:hypothetical protein
MISDLMGTHYNQTAERRGYPAPRLMGLKGN